MLSVPEDGYLKTNTMIFAEKMCQSISEMIGVPFHVKNETLKETGFKSPFRMTTFISFSGTIQGNYLCSLDELTALKIIDAFNEGMSEEEIRSLRGDYGGFVKEVLNLTVGQSIIEIEKNFGDLTFSPSTVVFGELEFPDFLSADVQIESDHGTVLCGFSLNLANLRIGQKLDEALSELENKTAEALEAKRNIASILELLPVGLVAIDQNGIILPGQSKSTKGIIGIEDHTDITGSFLPELILVDSITGQTWKHWLGLVFSKYGLIPFKDLVSLCELNEIRNSKKRVLKLEWLAVTKENSDELDKLLVVIDDITKQRELEARMEDLSKKHTENLELISQIINLSPDEVTDFVYDSSRLLTDAQKIVEGNNRDREFVNELFRTFHTLKGSSGQYQFKSIQDMAHKVEGHLRDYRDGFDNVDDGIINEVKTSIESAKNYLTRIQDIRTKLGGKDESLRDKARRDPSTIMVNLDDIKELMLKCQNIIVKGKSFIKDSYYINELENYYLALGDLKKIKISFFLSSLEMLVKNTSEKIGKKAVISMSSDLAVDVEIMRIVHQCFIHMINNALDHGIEIPEERLKLGKIENGVLIVSGKRENNQIIISLEDDGKGIDLVAVREKAMNEFNISKEQVDKMSDQELFQYLFKPGFTTKNVTTLYSGRGVGMDFINNSITKIGGNVQIQSTSGKGTTILLVINAPQM